MEVDPAGAGRPARRRSKRLALVSVSVWAALGPGAARAEVRLGALGGVGFTTLYQSGSENFATYDDRFVTRPAVGGVIDVLWAGRTSLRLEPLYAVKGSRYQDPACPCLRPAGYVPKDNDLHLSYVEMPILAVHTFDGGRWHPYLTAGLVPGLLTGARQVRDGREDDVSSLYQAWDLGLSLGGGLTHAPSRARPFVEARLTVSAFAVDDSSRRNVALHLLVGVSFSVSQKP
jgi:outer membrane protein with beta-barrel domain